MTIPEFSHLLGMILDYHGSTGNPYQNHPFSWRVVGEWSKMEAQFYVFYMFHIKTKLKTSKHTQKKGPHSFPTTLLGISLWFSFLRHCKELACRHGPRQDGRGILRSGTTRDAGNINEDGPEAYPHREYI